ncbi:hypothetical protein SAMN05443287_11052 [Micromonospora phaseoli]|uniref:Uncharacterized protein n=1 Tax=Micromonospora phaseoli TaxID=1144548 RepID=A0A1H7CNS1_9ACTN|nr:hypothetical protein [Micromonospora phaseoli]PZV91639.1 hypothetical protein CLV64_111158 [Micromonospora phaseoli]GIJ79270.1 hypothetical protein Xph01_37020 [Micromonospora phaseoli]SEJ91413.1 hypothetical protein SAMN05443287_11052 [Micromonospora phaseoli]
MTHSYQIDLGLIGVSAAVEVVVLAAIVWLLTRRSAPAIADRAPAHPVARFETLALLLYGLLAQLLGVALGHALGWHPISFHLAGTLVGTEDHIGVAETIGWATYNFTAFAVAPFLWFRRRYSSTQLCLRSTNRRRDTLIVVIILAAGSLTQLLGLSAAILALDGRQLALGVPLTFVLYLLGTGLPTLVFVQAILVPRLVRLVGTPGAVILGGLTYAALHLGDAWVRFTSLGEAVTSIGLVLLVYTMPGAFKTFLTTRTGNAWVHLWAYHAIAPHTLIDTPLIVRIFRL